MHTCLVQPLRRPGVLLESRRDAYKTSGITKFEPSTLAFRASRSTNLIIELQTIDKHTLQLGRTRWQRHPVHRTLAKTKTATPTHMVHVAAAARGSNVTGMGLWRWDSVVESADVVSLLGGRVRFLK